MGAKVSVVNQTPYNWYFVTQDKDRGYKHVGPGCTKSYDEGLSVWRYIYVRYENHSYDSFTYEFNTHKGNTSFILRETFDRSQIQMHCTSEGGTHYCPNYGKIEEDNRRQQEEERRRQQEEARRRQQQIEEENRRQEERRRQQQKIEEDNKRRQQEEERRRLERLEREQRIQQELNRESELSRLKLSRATEQLREKQRFRGQEKHHERTQVLHQQIEDDAAEIERNEVIDIEEKFKDLLLKYQITENKEIEQYQIWSRIKILQNELAVQYCGESNLSVWSQFTFDHAVRYNELSLTEKLTVLEASVKFIMHSSTEDDEDQPLGWEKKYHFFLGLLEQLNSTSPTLAERILLNVLDTISELSPKSRDMLGQMLFNRIWTPTEIMLLLCKGLAIKSHQLESVLHKAQTYHLDCILVLSALTNENPLEFLQEQIQNDKEKDADTIVKELYEANCPEKVLVLMKDVLRYMESELPQKFLVDLTKEQIDELKRKIRSLNFTNLDVKLLKDVLIGMSIAVQDCSTIITKDNVKIQGYFPRLTQLASLLLLLLAQVTENKGCFLEIGTGEGKSCILAMFATILAISGTKVDIVTSSPVLARRDQEEWKKFFEMFGVTSAVVPPSYSSAYSPEEQEEHLKDAYRQQIVYSTVGAFAADTLKQEFEKRTTRDTRQFELVIVDEVDYMTLDNGVQVTFLSHESSGFRHVEQVLSNIWAMISSCQPIQMLETGEVKWATRIQYFHKATTAAVMGLETSDSFSANEILLPGVTLGFYTNEDIERIHQAESTKEGAGDGNEDRMSKALSEIMNKLGVPEQYDLLGIFEEVLENSVVFKCYSLENKKAKCFEAQEKQGDLKVEMLLLEGGLACEIMSEKSLIDATVSAIKSSIKYSDNLQTAKESNNFIIIPVFLKRYIENQLPVFVQNALKAVEMTPGREYLIDTSPAAERDVTNSQDRDKYNAVIPVDFKASGVLEKNKKWGNGLQQFLEFKHQLAISPISNVTNYMSNFHFFKRYLSGRGIFGVSGTLGGKADQDFLGRHYKATSYIIPAHRHKRLVELPVIQVKGGNHPWIQTICETSWKVTERGQAVLVICEDVKTADELHKKIQDEGRFKAEQITLYSISEKHNIEKEKFCAGRIIIATNLGGRGTDIKVDESVNKCGGLFVLLTHFPHNRRVEKQIFGRTSRKGNPGMVQMVLNCDYLAPAYQGQSVEIMRQLREEYEIKRIHDMESDELVEINLKENLFSTFCKLLKDFDGHYSEKEKQDPMRMQLNDIPDCFKHHQPKFDYQPAINALKESWALWLTLHEDHINRHDEFGQLEAELIRTVNETSGKLLQGQCDNFYDHVKQAIVRTDLHCREKSKNDYGAKTYWQKVANSDPHYKAVALYNQAYITINLSEGNYKADAMKLLEDAKKSVDVYISEVSNTMVSCNLSVIGNKDQSTDSNNFQSQMEARMNIFKSWMTYIDNAMIKLKELEKDNSDAITEECSVYTLSEEKNFIVTNELRSLYDYGLGVVFEVKKKPKFCIDALICFILGVVQVLAGILICALTFGTASQFGMGLISEGVSDMINGIEGMIQGSFDWVSWAISKSISIGLSLITAGFSVIKKAVSSVFKVTKSLLNGTKSFSSVASEFIKSGKAMFTSLKGGVQSGLSSLSKESFKLALKNMTTSTVLKENFKFATKYAVQEIGKKSVLAVMNYAIDEALQEVFKNILQSSFKDVVTSSVKQSSKLDQTLVEFISSGVPKAALKKENFKIDQNYEKELKKTVGMLCKEILPDLILDCTTAQEVISRLSKVCEAASDLMKKAKLSGVHELAKQVLKVAEYELRLVQILSAIPTRELIQEKFVPELLESIHELQNEMPKYDQDGRHNLQDVQRLKGEILQNIAQNVSEKFISSCSKHMTSLMTSSFKSQLNSAVGQAVDKVTRRHKTQSFFDDQREKHNKRSASHKEVEQLSEENKTKLMQYTEDLCKADQSATALDVYVLTKSNLLGGKGVEITVADENGKELTVERYPGTNISADDIKLRLTKSAEVTHPSQADTQQYSGRFDIVKNDGRIISVNADHQNDLYHAVAQATGSETEDPKIEALTLRKKVKNVIESNLESYTHLLILQRGYDFCHKTPRKYDITGGSKKTTNVPLQKYLLSVKFISSGEQVLIKMFHLGFVGEFKSVVSARTSSKNTMGTLNTSHIPPKDSIRLAESVMNNPNSVSEFKNKNLPLYELISSIKTDSNGSNLIAMEVLGQDHKRALTTGSSSRSQMARKLLADTIISGDVELVLKRCMILHHPLTSQKLREALGEGIPSQGYVLSDEGIRGYYKAGYRNLVSEYSRLGILDQQQCERLDEWVNQNQHEDTNTAEYDQVLKALQP